VRLGPDHTRASGRRWAAVGLACAFALTVGTGVASAQSGGVTPPGDPAAPAPAPTTTTGPTQVFPLAGPHTFGDGFGVPRGRGRSHQGQDIMAACGQQALAVMNGRIVYNSFQSAAGNYIVLRNKKVNRDYVYMHLRKPGLPKGTAVTAGQWIGTVGDTGDATACHLHFEIWKGKWYRGGWPINPLPSLEAWDAYS
jgi:murein DD-endopeptidase MepM/ murein hydrolase activator NlpD